MPSALSGVAAAYPRRGSPRGAGRSTLLGLLDAGDPLPGHHPVEWFVDDVPVARRWDDIVGLVLGDDDALAEQVDSAVRAGVVGDLDAALGGEPGRGW